MGDYADMEIDRMIFGGGAWSDRPRRRSQPKPQICNCCNQPVHYNARGEKMSGGVLHRCPMPEPGRRLTLDDLVDGT